MPARLDRVVSLALLVVAAACRSAPPERPDIVVVVADDLDLRAARALPFYQRLAARGVDFRQHLTRTPICSPSRASLLTGLGWERHGVGFGGPRQQVPLLHHQEARTLGPLLQAAGYRTMLDGKYVNQTDCAHRPPGWDRWVSLCRAISDALDYKASDDGHRVAPGVYQTDFLRDQALAFLRSADARPAFVYVAPSHLHAPAERHADASVPAFAPPPSFAADRDAADV